MLFAPPDRRAYQLEFLFHTLWPESRSGMEPSADPLTAGTIHRHDLGKATRILFGRVIEGVAYTHFYRVQVENGMSTVPCVSLGQTSFSVMGARQLNTYSPGTGVYIILHPDAWFGVILGAEPDYQIDPTHALPDFIVQGSRVGLQVDGVHKGPFSLSEGGTIPDWSASRPSDLLTAGEWGAITETGLRVFLDSFMAALAVDETTGVWAFYLDRLLRVAGWNLQTRSCGRDREEFDDDTELHLAERHAFNLWEALGLPERPDPLHPPYREFTPLETQQTKPWYGRYEPFYDDQQGIHRVEEYRGYLGQLYKRLAKLLPFPERMPTATFPGVGASSLPETRKRPFRLADQTVFPGVFEETLLPTGEWMVRSAKGIILAKELRLEPPKQVRKPEQADGDTALNYRSDGVLYGATAPVPPPLHVIHDRPTMPVTPENPSLVRATALLDTLAYNFNWQGVVPFHYHSLDWYLANESQQVADADLVPKNLRDAVIEFGSLASSQFLTPQAVTMTVDERYGEVSFYRNGSSVVLHDDGSISFTGAFGEQLLFSGGSGYLDLPGDFWIRTGKSIIQRAGHDWVAEGNNSCDLVANRKDVRIKAERNLHTVSGNSGHGGTLLENRALCAEYDYENKLGEDVISSGVMVRANKAQFAVIVKEIFMTNQCSQVVAPGNMIVDMGHQKITTKSQTFDRRVYDATLDFFLNKGSANECWGDFALFGCELAIDGPVYTTDSYYGKGWLYLKEGHVATGISGEYENLVGVLAPQSQDILQTDLDRITNRVDELEAFEGESAVELEPPPLWCGATFSCRTPAQYHTVGLAIFEGRWQQQARLTNQVPAYWQENVVLANGVNTMPHPGYSVWKTASTFKRVNVSLFDFNPLKHHRVDRGTAYSEAVYATPSAVVADGNYPIIANN